MADTAPLPIGVTAIKPVERHGLEAVKWFLWDKDKGAIMGRTPLSWALITVFYIIYYSLLAGFWALMLFIFFQTIDDKEPTWVADKSIIGTRYVRITSGKMAELLIALIDIRLRKGFNFIVSKMNF